MISQEILTTLHTNQRLLLLELINRGVEVFPVDLSIELFSVEYKGHREYLLDRFSSVVPHVQTQLTADKFLTKKILKDNWLQTPAWDVFDLQDKDQILSYVHEFLHFPIVIKPNRWSHGDDVYMNIMSLSELETLLTRLYEEIWNVALIVEEQFIGNEYRVLFTSQWEYAVLQREPAYVIGNGIHTIKELADQESYHRTHPRTNSLCPILIDEAFLQKNQLSLDTVPPLWKRIYVRSNSNVAKWWVAINFTHVVHPSVLDIAKQALDAFRGLPYIGIDFMCKDISQSQKWNSYTIIEVNTNPGIAMHMLPGIWDPVDVASMLANIIFPETRKA